MKKEHDTHDLKRIDVHQSWNLNFWCEEFNLRADELKEIVRRVGPEISEIRLYLAKRLLQAWPSVY